MIRLLDILLSLIGVLVCFPLMILITLIALIDTGSPLFRQQRVGRNQRPFTLIKFRTMKQGTPSVPTHLASPASITRFGSFLRRTKLDELPQLWNVLKGEMSLVGPRPCLPDQEDLIKERALRRVFDARPGITGLAQLRGIDMSNPRLLAETDAEMLMNLTLKNYLKYIALTIMGRGAGDRVRTRDEGCGAGLAESGDR